jgi:hypothetical protein
MDFQSVGAKLAEHTGLEDPSISGTSFAHSHPLPFENDEGLGLDLGQALENLCKLLQPQMTLMQLLQLWCVEPDFSGSEVFTQRRHARHEAAEAARIAALPRLPLTMDELRFREKTRYVVYAGRAQNCHRYQPY